MDSQKWCLNQMVIKNHSHSHDNNLISHGSNTGDVTLSNQTSTGTIPYNIGAGVDFTDFSSSITLPVQPMEGVMQLYMQGKDVVEDRKDYLDVIADFPWVNGNNIKLLATYNRVKRMILFMGNMKMPGELNAKNK